MQRTSKQSTISCPKCGEKREVSRSVWGHIQAGRTQGLCLVCRHNPYTGGLPMQLYRTRFYRIWVQMRQRCNNPNSTAYKDYGGRGITVCDRWDSFENFIADMYPTYSDALTINRIDNNGNYEPRNCEWATKLEQSLNTRRNRFVTIDGTKLSVSQWASRLDVSQTRFYQLMKRGMTIEEAVQYMRDHRYTLNGKTQSLAKWSRELGFNQRTVRKRLARGIPFSKAIQ